MSLAVALCILAGAAWILVRAFGQLSFDEVLAAAEAQRSTTIAITVALTAISLSILGSYDVFAVRTVARGEVAMWRAWFAGAASNAVASTLGFQALTATAVRLRIYRPAGLGLAGVARVTAVATGALGLGFASVLALALIIVPGESHAALNRAIGAAMVAMMAVLVLWLSRRPRRFAFGPLGVALPSARLTAVLLVLGACEMAAAIGSLYVLMPADLAPSFPAFCAGVIGSVLLGIGSQTPGGIGVFEAAITAIVGGAGRADLLAALLLYRLIHNLVPFALAMLALGVHEIVQQRLNWRGDIT